MKITAIRGIMLRCTCSPISDALSTSTARQALLVKIETDAGLYGIGEAFTYGAPLKIMKYLVEEQLGPMLIGQDPTEIGMIIAVDHHAVITICLHVFHIFSGKTYLVSTK